MREITLAFSREAIKTFLHTVHDRLIDYAQKPSEEKRDFEFLHARAQISSRHNEILRTFLREMDHHFDQFISGELHAIRAGTGGNAALTLMDQNALEEDLALSAIRTRANVDYTEPLWVLTRRMTRLVGGKSTEHRMPISPGCFCQALQRSLVAMDVGLPVKLVIYKLFDRLFIARLAELYGQCSARLEALGVLPDLRYQIHKAKAGDSALFTGAQPQRRHASVPSSRIPVLEDVVTMASLALPSEQLSAADYQNQLLDSIQLLQDRLVARVPGQRVVPAGQPLQYSERQLVEAAVQLQQFNQLMAADILATAREIKPFDIAHAREQLVSQLQQITDSEDVPALGTDDARIIDLVGMLFEYILNDELIPDCVKALLSYLHTPFLKLAFAEADFFRRQDHPARLLLNTLADAGGKWVSNDGSCEFDMLEQIRKTVRSVLDRQNVDTRLIASLLMTVNSFVQKVELRVKLLEKRAMEQARGEDQLYEVKQRVNREIHQRVAEKEIPSAPLLFLLQPWTDYMVLVLLRFGDGSQSWRQSLELIDDLLWGLELTGAESEWRRWRQHYPWMETQIQKGFDMIGYDANKAFKLKRSIDRIYQLREKDLQPEAAPAELRNKLVQLAGRRASERTGSRQCTDREKAVLEKLRLIEFGSWFEFRDGHREKVAWFNPDSMQFLFVDQTGKRTGMKQGHDLAQAILAGEMHIVTENTKPLVERTMETIFSELNQQVQSAARNDRHAG
ncbi:DUF1631 family protein [Porticoccus sp.]|uniref:DUF1631 family protein n=1 Tax=Porticoccus sp. TaxID=2024853 RepID=UPI003F69D379